MATGEVSTMRSLSTTTKNSLSLPLEKVHANSKDPAQPEIKNKIKKLRREREIRNIGEGELH